MANDVVSKSVTKLFGRSQVPRSHPFRPLSCQVFVTILAATLVAVVEGGFRVAVLGQLLVTLGRWDTKWRHFGEIGSKNAGFNRD